MEAPTIYPEARQANALVRAPLRLNHQEARIFALALGCIHQHQTELPPIVIPISAAITGKRSGTSYELVNEACETLRAKGVHIETFPGTAKQTNTHYSIIDHLRLDRATGMITGLFASGIKPFLIQLVEQYTRVEIESLLTLKSAHAHRLYWLLSSWDDIGWWEVSVDALRQKLFGSEQGAEVESYPEYFDFRRYVLDPAVKELQKLDWQITYEPIKQGKKVEKVRFTVPARHHATKERRSSKKLTRGSKPRQNSLLSPTDPAVPKDRLTTRMEKLQLTSAQILELKKHVTTSQLLEKVMKGTHPLLRDFEAGNKVFDNLGATAMTLLKTLVPAYYAATK
jgi:plasmid replication initiation protein